MQKILSLLRRCVEDYDMIAPGERVAVGVSGGKDSLVLLAALARLAQFYPGGFSVEAFTVDMGTPGMDLSPLADYCREHIPQIKTCAPDATYLMWLDCRELGMSNEALHDFMIRKAKLGLNDGCSFGRSLNGFMRLNAACPRATLEQAMRQLEAAVNSL